MCGVGIIQRVTERLTYGAAMGAALETFEAEVGRRFSVDIDPVMLYGAGYSTSATTIPLSPRVSRTEAMSVPGVKRARDLIAGSLGTLPLALLGPDNQPNPWSLFDQPEYDVPRSVTLTRTFEDLLFEGVAWWQVVAWDWRGKPAWVKRLEPRSVTVTKDMRVYTTAQGNQGYTVEWIPDAHLIRFDSPNDPLLVAGARAIRACIALDAAALRFSDGAPPLDYFTAEDGVSPFATDEDAIAFLDRWQAARRLRATGMVPPGLKYNDAGFDAEKLQLAEARQHAVLEIARLAGVDPEELGVSVTSRTYANQFDRRKAFIDFTLGGFRQAFEDRLSMADVTPVGYKARLDLSDFLRSDDLTRMQVHEVALRIGAETEDEMRAVERKPALTANATPPRAIEAAPEESA